VSPGDLHAVVMAAGEGQRLRPLTELWPKPVLPIDGRPVVATLLRALASAGIERAHVVTGHLAEQVEELVGDGSAFGLEVAYARQPEALGSADAVRRALAAGARPPLVVTAADTVFRADGLAAAVRDWLASGAAGGLGVRPSDDGAKTRVTVADGRLGAIGSGETAAAPLWFLDEDLAASLTDVGGPPYELAEAFRAALAEGRDIRALDVGATRDLTHPADVVTRNFAYVWREETR
jgi:N-acetyl-alpha-D-muramate 1-phosphate uridylyltransferase